MAKHNLFLGQARGKVGSVVFSRLNGVQISRAYNPSPKNPKSWAQATQRAAFASISQYYKVFRYLIEQGQQGIKVGQPSIQDWQSRTLKQLKSQIGVTPMVLNVKGVQYPQLLPISLTNGTLPSLSYDIRTYAGAFPQVPHHGLCLTFNGSYTTTEALAAMTLGDVYAMTPGLQRGFQLTFALLGFTIGRETFDYNNRAFAAMWAQYVIAEDADEKLPFFTAVEGDANHVQINPAILTSSWGERFTPRWGLRLIDGIAVAFLDAPEYARIANDGIIAGCCITSYFNGSEWARSTSPMAIVETWAMTDQTDVIETYQQASRSTSSDLYLNQAKTKTDTTSTNKLTYSGYEARQYDSPHALVSSNEFGTTISAARSFDYAAAAVAVEIALDFAEPYSGAISVSASGAGLIPESYSVEGIGTQNIVISVPVLTVSGGAGSEAILTIVAGGYTRQLTFNAVAP